MKIRQILKSKKGFTMTELIVVIVIIAVLAAALIPSFLGFVRNAEEATLYNEARVGMVAFQMLITENGKGPTTGEAEVLVNSVTAEAFFVGLNHGTGRLSVATNREKFFEAVNNDITPNFTSAQNSANAVFSNITVDTIGRRVTGLSYTSGDTTVRVGVPIPV